MRKIFLHAILFMFIGACSQKKQKLSANKYFPFQYENKWGVSDNLGNEVIIPVYDIMEIINGKKLKDIIVLKTVLDTDNFNFDPNIGNTKDVFFERSTGTYKEYENYTINEVKIENINYSSIDYSVLENEESRKKIKLNSRYYYLQNLTFSLATRTLTLLWTSHIHRADRKSVV